MRMADIYGLNFVMVIPLAGVIALVLIGLIFWQRRKRSARLGQEIALEAAATQERIRYA